MIYLKRREKITAPAIRYIRKICFPNYIFSKITTKSVKMVIHG